MSSKPATVIDAAIAANLAALTERLATATHRAREASQAMANHRIDLAIGTLLMIEEMLPEAQSLFSAILALHRGKRGAR